MDQKTLNELRNYYDNTDTSGEIADAELDEEVTPAPMVGITVRLPATRLEQVRKLAAREHLKPTALIRRWVDEAVDRDCLDLPTGGGSLSTWYMALRADLSPQTSHVFHTLVRQCDQAMFGRNLGIRDRVDA